jgi:phosphotransacetylase
MIKSFAELREQAKAKIKNKSAPKMGIIYPRGGKCLKAALQADDEGYVTPVLIGHKVEIESTAKAADQDVSKYTIMEAENLQAAVNKAVAMAKSGEIDFLLKGCVDTTELVNALLGKESEFLSKGKTLSHIGIMQTPKYHKLMFVTDSAVNASPNPADTIGIVQNASALARLMGIERPRAALLAAVEAIYPAIPVTMEEAAIAKMSDRGQIKGCFIDGPLSFDVAINTEVAHSKGITDSKVAGDTDIFACPSMETADGVYKAMVMYAKAEAAGIIYGGMVPVASTYALDPIANIFNSIILAAYVTLH